MSVDLAQFWYNLIIQSYGRSKNYKDDCGMAFQEVISEPVVFVCFISRYIRWQSWKKCIKNNFVCILKIVWFQISISGSDFVVYQQFDTQSSKILWLL